MRNKKRHILSVLFIIFMLIMAVATSRKPPREMINSISYETRGDYYLFKIKTKYPPEIYGIFGYNNPVNGFDVIFNDFKEWQEFKLSESGDIITEIYALEEQEKYMINESGEKITEKDKDNVKKILLEQKVLTGDDFGTFTEDEYFIIKIKKEIFKHENPRLIYIYLNDKTGKLQNEYYMEKNVY